MRLFSRHWPRIAVTLIPLVFAWLHAGGVLRMDVLQRLDDILSDARLRANLATCLERNGP
jgi:adenylate cyclase